MKTLLIVRHGKSSWDDMNVNDMERPLKRRGQKNSREGAHLLKGSNVNIDLLLSSPAVRAFDTACIFAKVLRLDAARFEVRDSLYLPDFSTLLKTVLYADDRHRSLMIVGHEPSLSLLTNHFLQQPVEKVVTASISMLQFSTRHWKDISASNLKKGSHHNRHNWKGEPIS